MRLEMLPAFLLFKTPCVSCTVTMLARAWKYHVRMICPRVLFRQVCAKWLACKSIFLVILLVSLMPLLPCVSGWPRGLVHPYNARKKPTLNDVRYAPLVLAFLSLMLAAGRADAGYFNARSNGELIASGQTPEAACTRAVGLDDRRCNGTERVHGTSTPGRYRCHFTEPSLNYACSAPLLCTGHVCRYGKVDLQLATCNAPLVYNPYTQNCDSEIAQKNEPGCEKLTNNPVNYSTGNKSISEVDFSSAGEGTLRFGRRWNSYNKQWLFSHRQYAQISANYYDVHTVTIYTETGRAVQFWVSNGIARSDLDVKDTLTLDGTQWLYTTSSGDKEWFDTAGKLLRVQRRDGGGLTISYPNAATIMVADDYGKTIALTLDASDRVVSMIDPDGREYGYSYNSNGDLEVVTFPPDAASSSPIRQYQYNDPYDSGLITEILDENGDLYKTIVYDISGRVTLSGLSDGSIDQSTFDYTYIDAASDPRVTVTNALGKQAIYHLERLFGVSNVKAAEGVSQPSTDCLSDIQNKTYDAASGRLKRKADRAGNVTYYEYYTDAPRYGLVSKRVEGEGSADARTFEFDWYPATRQQRQEKLLGVQQTDYTFNPNGRLHTRTETDLTGLADVSSRTWTKTYTYHDPGSDTQIATLTLDGPRTDVTDTTVTEYSAQGYLIKSTNAMGHVTQYQNHNGRGQPRRVIDVNNIITDMTYTARGWLGTLKQDLGGINALTVFEYDNVGQITGITLADGVHLSFEYDNAHRLQATQNGLGQRITFDLDAAGNPRFILYKNQGGTITQSREYDFDGLSRLRQQFGNDGQHIRYIYDEKDHLTAINNGVNSPTVQGFDTQNRLETAIDADSNPMYIAYNPQNLVTRVTDERGLATDYAHDGFGELQTLISPDTGTFSYDYDAAGNRTKQTDARGVITTYAFDALNRLKMVTYPDQTKNMTYSYDNWQLCNTCNGRLAALKDSSGQAVYIYDALGRMNMRYNNVTLPGAAAVRLVTDFDFNKAGRLEQITFPNGPVVNYGFDAAGQVDTVTYQTQDPNNSLLTVDKDLVTHLEYQPFGPIKGATYGNFRQLNRTYDLDGRLDTQIVTAIQSLDYEYDRRNNVEVIENLIDNSRNEYFTYDSLNRLDTAAGKYGDIDYDYDEVGHREKRTIVRDGIIMVEDYQIDSSSHRLDLIDIDDGMSATTREFEYDAAGNITLEKQGGATHMKPHYDDTNRMDSVSP
jgi:YD repeat-containing protein